MCNMNKFGKIALLSLLLLVSCFQMNSFLDCSALSDVLSSPNLGKEQSSCDELTDGFVFDENGDLCSYDGTSEDVVVPEDTRVIKMGAFLNHEEIKSIALPSGLTVIEDYAFSGCSNLQSLQVPDSVETIGSFAFSDCRNLQTVYLGAGVKNLGYMVFWSNSRLKSIEVSDKNTTFASFRGVLYDKSFRVLIKCPQGFSGKFKNLKNIQKVCAYAFAGCNKLTKISFDCELEYIGEAAFFDCNSLFRVELGKNVRYVGSCAFAECILLDNVHLPLSTEYIGSSAFYRCTSLKNIKVSSKKLEMDVNIFKECSKDLVITGYADSDVQEYSEKFGLNFQSVL